MNRDADLILKHNDDYVCVWYDNRIASFKQLMKYYVDDNCIVFDMPIEQADKFDERIKNLLQKKDRNNKTYYEVVQGHFLIKYLFIDGKEGPYVKVFHGGLP